MAIDETWLLPYIGAAASDGGLAFDIGANVGDVTEVLAENFDGVLAVEPDPRAFGMLLAKGLKNVGCQHCAAAARNGSADLLLRPHSVQSSFLEEHPIGAGDQVHGQTQALDNRAHPTTLPAVPPATGAAGGACLPRARIVGRPAPAGDMSPGS